MKRQRGEEEDGKFRGKRQEVDVNQLGRLPDRQPRHGKNCTGAGARGKHTIIGFGTELGVQRLTECRDAGKGNPGDSNREALQSQGFWSLLLLDAVIAIRCANGRQDWYLHARTCKWQGRVPVSRSLPGQCCRILCTAGMWRPDSLNQNALQTLSVRSTRNDFLVRP